MPHLGLLLALAWSAAGCQSESVKEQTLAQLPEYEAPAREAAVVGSNTLGDGLLEHTASRSGLHQNVAVSPYLLAETFALWHGSAEGTTIDVLAKVLGTGSTLPDEVASMYLARRAEYASLTGSPYPARVGLWSVRPVFFDKAYYPVLERRYTADIERAGGATRNGVRAVNRWVAEHTGGAFPQPFQQLERHWILLALGALRFEVAWQTGFDPVRTAEAEFRAEDGPVQALTMQGVQPEARHVAGFALDGQRLDAVEVPLRDGRLRLLAVRSSEESNLAPMLRLTEIQALRDSLSPQSVRMSIPKVSISHELDIMPYVRLMPEFLNGMQMHFGKLSPELTTGEHISQMRQYIALEVSEGASPPSAQAGSAPGVAVAFDQPFLLFVVDGQDGLVLLSALVRNPTRM